MSEIGIEETLKDNAEMHSGTGVELRLELCSRTWSNSGIESDADTNSAADAETTAEMESLLDTDTCLDPSSESDFELI